MVGPKFQRSKYKPLRYGWAAGPRKRARVDARQFLAADIPENVGWEEEVFYDPVDQPDLFTPETTVLDPHPHGKTPITPLEEYGDPGQGGSGQYYGDAGQGGSGLHAGYDSEDEIDAVNAHAQVLQQEAAQVNADAIAQGPSAAQIAMAAGQKAADAARHLLRQFNGLARQHGENLRQGVGEQVEEQSRQAGRNNLGEIARNVARRTQAEAEAARAAERAEEERRVQEQAGRVQAAIREDEQRGADEFHAQNPQSGWDPYWRSERERQERQARENMEWGAQRDQATRVRDQVAAFEAEHSRRQASQRGNSRDRPVSRLAPINRTVPANPLAEASNIMLPPDETEQEEPVPATASPPPQPDLAAASNVPLPREPRALNPNPLQIGRPAALPQQDNRRLQPPRNSAPTPRMAAPAPTPAPAPAPATRHRRRRTEAERLQEYTDSSNNAGKRDLGGFNKAGK